MLLASQKCTCFVKLPGNVAAVFLISLTLVSTQTIASKKAKDNYKTIIRNYYSIFVVGGKKTKPKKKQKNSKL